MSTMPTCSCPMGFGGMSPRSCRISITSTDSKNARGCPSYVSFATNPKKGVDVFECTLLIS